MSMRSVRSKDGTSIAFDQSGQGPALVIVGGVLGDHHQQAGLAALLADQFTVYNIDRRGHGASGYTPPYAIEREVEDLDALLPRLVARRMSMARPIQVCCAWKPQRAAWPPR